eukprot:m.4838 g.4838  ORF g.4838 m.4838 type:complete len:522 (+) comp7221_c1_seq1:779-2344(+)
MADWLNAEIGEFKLEQGDFLDVKFKPLIQQADVIFVNNYVFGPKLNEQLKQLFDDYQLKQGCRIISSLSFAPTSHTINSRTLGQIASMLKVKKVTYMGQGVSWTSKPFSYFIHTVDQSLMEKFFQTQRPITLKMDVSEALADSEIAAAKPRRQPSSTSAFALCTAALEEVVEEAAKQSAAFEDKYGQQTDEIASLAAKEAQQLDGEHRRLQKVLAETKVNQTTMAAQSAFDVTGQTAAVTKALVSSIPAVNIQDLGSPIVALGVQAATALHCSSQRLVQFTNSHSYMKAAVPTLQQWQDNVAKTERLTQLCQQVLQAAGGLPPDVTMVTATMNQLHAALRPLRTGLPTASGGSSTKPTTSQTTTILSTTTQPSNPPKVVTRSTSAQTMQDAVAKETAQTQTVGLSPSVAITKDQFQKQFTQTYHGRSPRSLATTPASQSKAARWKSQSRGKNGPVAPHTPVHDPRKRLGPSAYGKRTAMAASGAKTSAGKRTVILPPGKKAPSVPPPPPRSKKAKLTRDRR